MGDLVDDVVNDLFDTKMCIVDGILDNILEVVVKCSRPEDDITIIDTWSRSSTVPALHIDPTIQDEATLAALISKCMSEPSPGPRCDKVTRSVSWNPDIMVSGVQLPFIVTVNKQDFFEMNRDMLNYAKIVPALHDKILELKWKGIENQMNDGVDDHDNDSGPSAKKPRLGFATDIFEKKDSTDLDEMTRTDGKKMTVLENKKRRDKDLKEVNNNKIVPAASGKRKVNVKEADVIDLTRENSKDNLDDDECKCDDCKYVTASHKARVVDDTLS